MPLEPPDAPPPPPPIDYRSPDRPRPRRRAEVVVHVGGVVAAFGVILFCSFHLLAPIGGPMTSDHRYTHELLWGAFGIAVMLAGTLILAVGLAAWCREDAD